MEFRLERTSEHGYGHWQTEEEAKETLLKQQEKYAPFKLKVKRIHGPEIFTDETQWQNYRKGTAWYEIHLVIETLEELIRFVKTFGQIVLDENTIEVYDDYRE